MRDRTSSLIALLLGIVLFAGCVTAPLHRANPSLPDRAKSIKSVALLPPRVEVFQIDAGGTREKMEDWSTEAKNNLMTAIKEELKSRSLLPIKPLPENSLSKEVKANLDETFALFDAVSASVILHTYGPHQWRFEEKIENFDYTLGNEVEELRTERSDVLLIVKGVDHIWTEGRKALQAFSVILGLGAAVGTGVIILPELQGGTGIIVALVDPHEGSILWYSQRGSGSGYDLRDRESAASLVKELFKDFPIAK